MSRDGGGEERDCALEVEAELFRFAVSADRLEPQGLPFLCDKEAARAEIVAAAPGGEDRQQS